MHGTAGQGAPEPPSRGRSALPGQYLQEGRKSLSGLRRGYAGKGATPQAIGACTAKLLDLLGFDWSRRSGLNR